MSFWTFLVPPNGLKRLFADLLINRVALGSLARNFLAAFDARQPSAVIAGVQTGRRFPCGDCQEQYHPPENRVYTYCPKKFVLFNISPRLPSSFLAFI
jgi:hypothetical protein